MSTELTLPPVRPTRNRINGQYLKGHEPANKGKEWDEWMSKKGQRRAAKGWKNLEDHRIANGQKYGGRNRKTVIALTDDGKFRVFDNIQNAAIWIGGNRENITRCCRMNASRKVKQRSWAPGQPKGTSEVNTDHRYKGVRWYFETDTTWMEKYKAAQ